jgi:acetyl esterase
MRNVAPLHPEAKEAIAVITELERSIVPPVTVEKMRQLMHIRTERLAAAPPDVDRIENRFVEHGRRIQVPIRMYYPRTKSQSVPPALIYFHGGGFVVGDLDMVETICRTICRDADVVVISADYRLAPENRFPAGLEDAIAVTRWVVRHAEDIGVDARRLAVAGDSAGGNLAAVVAQSVKADIPLKYQVLVYPVTDATCAQPSHSDLGTGYPLTAEKMRAYFALYLVNKRDALSPRASPLLAPSFAGLPPALVVLAGLDPLVDEGRAYADKLQAAGVAAEIVEVSDHPHGFLGWTAYSQAARETLALLAKRVRQNLH